MMELRNLEGSVFSDMTCCKKIVPWRRFEIVLRGRVRTRRVDNCVNPMKSTNQG